MTLKLKYEYYNYKSEHLRNCIYSSRFRFRFVFVIFMTLQNKKVLSVSCDAERFQLYFGLHSVYKNCFSFHQKLIASVCGHRFHNPQPWC